MINQDMTQSTKEQPVLVTGATGYVAGWLVKRLLDDGYTVHAAVRDPSNKEKLKYLDALAEQSPGNIRYFKTDLLEPGSYAEAMDGCAVVFHTASPFTLAVKDVQKELVDPALLGTRSILEQAKHCQSVKRVVVTSSTAAICSDAADMQNAKGEKLSEEDWNETSSIDHQPYSFSKVVAEREAWKIAGAQDRWDLVTINPSFVLGPGINPFATSETFTLFKQMGDGTVKTGVPDMALCAVDVRDVADAESRSLPGPTNKGREAANAAVMTALTLKAIG